MAIARANKVPQVGSASTNLTQEALHAQTAAYQGSGGTSKDNRHLGFVPAFFDEQTGDVYLSRFVNGKLAPLHILDGMPAHLIESRDARGQVLAVKGTVIAGFFRQGHFYTRQAAAAVIGNTDDLTALSALGAGIVPCHRLY